MKNILIALSIIFVIMPVFAGNADSFGNNVIEDELLKSKNFYKKIKPCVIKNDTPITDELIQPHKEKYRDVFELSAYSQGKYEQENIEDELISQTFKKRALNLKIKKKDHADDYFIEKKINLKNVRIVKAKNKYDFTKKQVPVKIKIANHLKSTKNLSEGSVIPFFATHDFIINGKNFKKGTKILGRIENISDSDKMGVPECLKIDNFYIDDEQEIILHGSITKTGANRSIWVYPLYQAGNICFYVAGFVFVPIHGGRAKLLTNETFTVFYETP